MKYLILLMLLLLFSCTEKEIDQSALKLGKVHTHILYHKSAPEYNLKGPVKEVRQKVYRVEGHIRSYRILALDTITTRQKDELLRFNKQGLITYHKKRSANSDRGTFPRLVSFLKTTKQYTYNRFNILTKEEENEKELSLPDSIQPAKLLDSDNRITYYHFVGNKMSVSYDGRVANAGALATLSLNDYQVIYRNLDPIGEKHLGTNEYTLGKDGVYRMSAFKSGNVMQLIHFEFEGKKLIQETVSNTRDTVDLGTNTLTYNDQMDIVHINVDYGSLPHSSDTQWEYKYQYDKHNNWIEKVVFSKGKAVKATRREITYYK